MIKMSDEHVGKYNGLSEAMDLSRRLYELQSHAVHLTAIVAECMANVDRLTKDILAQEREETDE